jgi:hypothetical protein
VSPPHRRVVESQSPASAPNGQSRDRAFARASSRCGVAHAGATVLAIVQRKSVTGPMQSPAPCGEHQYVAHAHPHGSGRTRGDRTLPRRARAWAHPRRGAWRAASIPEIIWEASLGIYLTFTGFKASSAVLDKSRDTGVRPGHQQHPLTHALDLAADEVYVLSTGGPCTLTEPPRGALAVKSQAGCPVG